MAPDWFVTLLTWKRATTKTKSRCVRLFGEPIGPSLADLGSEACTVIAGRIYTDLNIPMPPSTAPTLVDETPAVDESEGPGSPGSVLEQQLEAYLQRQLGDTQPDRGWGITRTGGVDRFDQYRHLAELQRLFETQPDLRSTVGQDYAVSTDVMVSLPNPRGWQGPPILHAAVSSKLTIRSDRVQNIRYEFGMLVKNRKGRLPHLVVVTAEPLPSRLVSIARGTGEIDAVYHLLFDELDEATRDLASFSKAFGGQYNDWRELVDQGRVRPFDELAPALASG